MDLVFNFNGGWLLDTPLYHIEDLTKGSSIDLSTKPERPQRPKIQKSTFVYDHRTVAQQLDSRNLYDARATRASYQDTAKDDRYNDRNVEPKMSSTVVKVVWISLFHCTEALWLHKTQ